MEEKKKNKIFIICSAIAAVLGVVAIVFGLLTTNNLKSNGNNYQDERKLGDAGCSTTEKYCQTGTLSDEYCYGGAYGAQGSISASECSRDYSGYYTYGTCYATKTDASEKCTKCESGYYLSGISSCTRCPAGKACDGTATGITTCSENYYSIGGATSCTKCNGTVTTTNGLNTGCVPTTCEAGKFMNSSNECEKCPDGYTSDAGSTMKSQCYITVTAGKYKTLAMGTTVANCEVGTYSVIHKSYYASGDQCTICGNGYYNTAEGSGGCSKCSDLTGNYYCNGHIKDECPSGQEPNSTRTGCDTSIVTITPSVKSCSDKIYDGTTTATCTFQLSGVNASNDDVQLTKASCTFASAAVGTNKTVTCTGLELTGRDASIYTLSSTSVTGTASIEIKCCRKKSDGTYEFAAGTTATCVATTQTECDELNNPYSTETECKQIENHYWAANKCVTCPPGYRAEGNDSRCFVIVPAGSYLVSSGPGTEKCPINTYSNHSTDQKYYLRETTGLGSEACKPCGSGMTSPMGSTSESACVPTTNSCSISLSSDVTEVSPGGGDKYSGAGDNITVTATINGDGCNGGNISFTAENAERQGNNPSGQMNNGMTVNVVFKATSECNDANITARLVNNGKTYTSNTVTIRTSSKWVKSSDGTCVTDADFNSHAHSAEEADGSTTSGRGGTVSNVHYIELGDTSSCSGSDTHWVEVWTRGCGNYTPTTPTTYACYANAATLDDATKIGWLTKASTELTYPITTGWFGVPITKDNYSEQCTVCACYADAKTIANATKVKWICNSDSTAATDKKTYTEHVRYGKDGTTEITVKNYTSQCVPPSQKYEEPKYCYANAADIKDATMAVMLTVSEYNQKIKDTTFKYRYPIKDANGNQVTNENYCKPSACYVDTAGTYKWAEVGTEGTGYTKVEIYTKDACKNYAECLAEVDKDGNYKQVVWSTSKSDIDAKLATQNWVQITGVSSDDLCHPGACYKKDNDVQWIGTGQSVPTGYTKVDDSECSYKPPEPYKEPACYVHKLGDGSVQYVWGTYESVGGYSKINISEEYCVTSRNCYKYTKDGTYHTGDYSLNDDYVLVSDSYCKLSPAPPTAFDKSKVMYIAMLFLALAGVGLVSYGNLKKKKA